MEFRWHILSVILVPKITGIGHSVGVANMSVTSRARGIWRTTRQTDKLNEEVVSIFLVTSM